MSNGHRSAASPRRVDGVLRAPMRDGFQELRVNALSVAVTDVFGTDHHFSGFCKRQSFFEQPVRHRFACVLRQLDGLLESQ